MSQQNARELVIARGNEDGPPETFTFLCGIRTRSFNVGNNQVDTTIPDCDVPSNPIVNTAEPGRQTITFNGQGLIVTNTQGKAFLEDSRLQRIKNYRVTVPGWGTWEGPFMVGDLELSGEMEEKVAFSASWVPTDNSQLVFTPA